MTARAADWTSSFSGVIAAPVTPMSADGGLALDVVPRLVDFLLEHGVAGLMVGGTTGEFITMTTAERAATLEVFVAAANGRVPVIAHVGHVFLREAVELMGVARHLGVDAVAAIAPYFHRVPDEVVARHLRDIATRAATLPFFAYHFPAAAGNRVTRETFAELTELPNTAGIKLSVATWDEIVPFLDVLDDQLVCCGNDGLLTRFVAAGGRAIVSGTASACPDAVVPLFDAARAGRSTDVLEAELERRVQATGAGAPDQLKAALVRRGIPVGPGRVRTTLD